MDSFHTPGILKLWNYDRILETKYKTIHQIPIMTLDRKEINLSEDKNIAIVHYRNSQKCHSFAEKLHKLEGYNVYYIPDQNSKESYDEIRKNKNDSLGKMVMNGPHRHPLFKYLLKNCRQLYNNDTQFADKDIKGDIGVFLYNGKKTEYYPQNKINEFASKISTL